MKVRIEIEGVLASVAIDGAWTPELVATVLRQCGDEAMRVVRDLDLVDPLPDDVVSEAIDEGGDMGGD